VRTVSNDAGAAAELQLQLQLLLQLQLQLPAATIDTTRTVTDSAVAG